MVVRTFKWIQLKLKTVCCKINRWASLYLYLVAKLNYTFREIQEWDFKSFKFFRWENSNWFFKKKIIEKDLFYQPWAMLVYSKVLLTIYNMYYRCPTLQVHYCLWYKPIDHIEKEEDWYLIFTTILIVWKKLKGIS